MWTTAGEIINGNWIIFLPKLKEHNAAKFHLTITKFNLDLCIMYDEEEEWFYFSLVHNIWYIVEQYTFTKYMAYGHYDWQC
jgi:hypothetical protein